MPCWSARFSRLGGGGGGRLLVDCPQHWLTVRIAAPGQGKTFTTGAIPELNESTVGRPG
jgi:hypothetical protein